MEDEEKSREELIAEIKELRSALANLEKVEIESKLFEEALRDSEERYRLLYEFAGDAIYIYDSNLRLLSINRMASELSGYTEEELLGCNVLELGILHPDDLGKAMQDIKRLFSGEKIVKDELRFIRKDGSVALGEVTGAALYGREGKVVAIANIVRDITERRKAEEALQESEILYRRITDNMRDIISRVNAEGTNQFISPSVKNVLGYDPGELLGRSAFEHVHPDDLAEVLKTFNQTRENPRAGSAIYRYRHANGHYVWLETLGSPLFDEEGNLIGATFATRDITERKQTDEALRESEERYRRLVETASDIIFTLNTDDGTISSLNPAFEKITGWKREDWLGRHFLEIVHPEDRPLSIQLFHRFREESKSLIYEQRVITKTGDYRLLEFTSTSEVLNGRIVSFSGIARDITERRKLEEELRKSEERYRTLVETSPDSIALTDIRGNILMVNQQAVKLFGYEDPDELIGRNVLDLFVPEDRTRALESMRDKSGSGTVRNAEYRMTKKGGTTFMAELSASLVLDAEGKPIAFMGVTRDISERKRALEVLRTSEERYRAIFEATGTAMCTVGKDTTITFVNGEFERITGYAASDIEGVKRLLDFIVPEDVANFSNYHRKILEGRRDVKKHFGCRIANRYRDVLFVLVSMGLLPGTENCVVSLIDITREKSYERTLEERAQQLRNFLDIASHELRHPITIIKGYVQLLGEIIKDAPIESVQNILDAIDASTVRLDRLGDELLDVSRIESNQFEPKRRELDLKQLAKQAIDEMRARGNDNPFEIRVDDRARYVQADEEKITRLLVILLENAVKFSPPSLPIEIVTEGGAGEIMVSILDRGPGIPPGAEEKIFDRFFQVEDVLHHSKPGLGLGLFIAREIAEAHSGNIWYEPRPDGGSIFRFTLPASTG